MQGSKKRVFYSQNRLLKNFDFFWFSARSIFVLGCFLRFWDRFSLNPAFIAPCSASFAPVRR
jgi:hypothetical protein